MGQNLRVHGRALRASVSLGDLGKGSGEFFPDGVRMARLARSEGGLWAQLFSSELNSEPWTRGKGKPGDGKIVRRGHHGPMGC